MDTIKQYLRLCWFDVSPLELPRSTVFFKQNLAFNVLMFIFIHFNMTDDIESISEVIIETLLNLGFIALTLSLNRSMYAYMQVATAILFTENCASLFLLPVMFWATIAEDWLSYSFLTLILLLNMTMIASIFKKSIGINILAGFIMALLYLVFSFGGGFALNSLLTG
jgi:hypothetical protein